MAHLFNTMNLYGKNQVIERIRAKPKSITKVYLNKNSNLALLHELAKEAGISCVFLPGKEFSRRAKHFHTQGVIAEIKEFSYARLEDILNLPKDKKYTLIALSNITDPQNVGSILRSAACFGNFALIIPKHRTVQINETVLKVACGGENYIPVVQVTNLIPALEKAKKAGYWVAGCFVNDGVAITELKISFPLCIIIGSENKGIRKGIIPHLDFKFTLPMPGIDLSLNAAVACAIFCYEIMRQRTLNC